MSATKLVANHKEIVKTLAPFFPGKIHFRSEKGNYDCALCGTNVRDSDVAALSYGTSHYGTWAHMACVKAAKAQVIDDKEQKIKAQKAAQKRDQKARKTGGKTTQQAAPPMADTTSPQGEAQPTESEARYETLMSQALDAIKTLQAQNAGLVAENDQLKVHLKAVTTKLLAQEVAA